MSETEKQIETFKAITNFVDDLWEVFGVERAVTPLALYRRLVQVLKPDDERIAIVVQGFEDFFEEHESKILGNDINNIPFGTVIRFGNSDKICIDIQKILYQSDKETTNIIRQHLITISALINPDESKLDELSKTMEMLNIDTGTKEGQLISDLVKESSNAMENVDTANPMSAIMGLMQSGVMTNLMSGLQNGVESGELDMSKMMNMVTGLLQMSASTMKPPTGEK